MNRELIIERLRGLELDRIAISATIEPSGALGPVGGLWPKLLAAAEESSKLGLLRVVVVAEGQTDVPSALLEPNASPLRVVTAATIEEAIEKLCKVPGLIPPRFSDDFSGLDTDKWWTPKQPPAADDGWLVLSSAPGNGCEVQSRPSFLYGSLEFEATSGSWPVDTSMGFEVWGDTGHKAVVVTNGHLGIIDHSQSPPNEWYQPIPGWDSLRACENVFRIEWAGRSVELLVNGRSAVSYSGSLTPGTGLRIRFNASQEVGDVVRVGHVRFYGS